MNWRTKSTSREGETEFEAAEVEMLKNVAESYCTPRFIDALNNYIVAANL